MAGPFNKWEQSPARATPGVAGVGWRYSGAYKWSRTWQTQPRPHRAPLPFSFYRSTVTKANQYTVDGLGTKYDTVAQAAAVNKAYSKLINGDYSRGLPGLGAKAELGVTVAERHQAMAMIVARATQLRKFTNAVRHLQFNEAANILGVLKNKKYKRLVQDKKLRRRSKAFASNYLEYHFGWVPLIQDIGNAVEVLQSEIPTTLLKSTATIQTSGSNTKVLYGERTVTSWVTSVTCRMQTEVYISNPNLRLASQLGFVNPAALLWEIVPFSFIVDWFVNVNDFLNSFTDFLGLTQVNSQTVIFGKTSESMLATNATTGAKIAEGAGETVRCSRTTGITGPKLKLRPVDRLSPTRGAVSISLLLQSMKIR